MKIMFKAIYSFESQGGGANEIYLNAQNKDGAELEAETKLNEMAKKSATRLIYHVESERLHWRGREHMTRNYSCQ